MNESDARFVALLNDEAKRAVDQAEADADLQGSSALSTDYLLIALLGSPDSACTRALAEQNISAGDVRVAQGSIQTDPQDGLENLPGLTIRAKEVLQIAVHEARQAHHRDVSVEHLSLALFGRPNTNAAEILKSLGFDVDAGVSAVQRHMPPAAFTPSVSQPSFSTSGVTEFRHLVRVVSIAQTDERLGVEVSLLALEIYDEGAIITARFVWVEDKSGDAPGSNTPHPQVMVSDDRGTEYNAQFGRGSGSIFHDSRECWWRLEGHITPTPIDATYLDVRIPRIQITAIHRTAAQGTLIDGDWTFNVPLH